jgi:acyl-CoA reductase-like NAD-dependent aldehyde dehydrogenase
VAAAEKAFPAWAATSAWEKQAVLMKLVTRLEDPQVTKELGELEGMSMGM